MHHVPVFARGDAKVCEQMKKMEAFLAKHAGKCAIGTGSLLTGQRVGAKIESLRFEAYRPEVRRKIRTLMEEKAMYEIPVTLTTNPK